MRHHPSWSDVVPQAALTFAVAAAFPRLVHRLRWPSRLGAKGLVAYALANTVQLFAIRVWLMPFIKRLTEERRRAELELREHLGREPTTEELLARLGYTDD